MSLPARLRAQQGDTATLTSRRVTRTYTGEALKRRQEWGKQAGAKVAAAYKQLTEAK